MTVQPIIVKSEHPVPDTIFVDSAENSNTASSDQPSEKLTVEPIHDASRAIAENTRGETTEVTNESTAEIVGSLFVEQAPLAISGQIPRDKWLERELPAFDNDMTSVGSNDSGENLALK